MQVVSPFGRVLTARAEPAKATNETNENILNERTKRTELNDRVTIT